MDRATGSGGAGARLGARLRRQWRRWLRAGHRDVGYLIIGLTVVYALSGIAVNHIDDWDSNYVAFERTHQVATPLPAEPEAAAALVLSALAIDAPTRDVYLATDDRLEIELDRRFLHVDLTSGEVFDEGQEARFFFRAANWLHENRGKAAWTYVADSYALLLLLLALSGLFMLKGRKGLVGRGAILVALGAAVPIVYFHLSGGPGG